MLEEADETVHWLEFIRDARLTASPELPRLLDEARQMTRIFAASRRTASANAALERRRGR